MQLESVPSGYTLDPHLPVLVLYLQLRLNLRVSVSGQKAAEKFDRSKTGRLSDAREETRQQRRGTEEGRVGLLD